MLNSIETVTIADAATVKEKNKRGVPHFYENAIISFYSSIRKILSQKTIADTSSLDRSHCFRVISEELTWLASQEGEKELFLYTNIYENSPLCTVYSQGKISLSDEKIKTLMKIFEDSQLMPDNLQGITVYFCYSPMNREDDEWFNKMVSIYVKMIIDRGGKVSVVANNSFPE